MTEKKAAGHTGVKDVIAKISCPNCGKRLMLLPSDYPLSDLQCTACLKKYTRSPNKYRGKYTMFNYAGLSRLPQIVVFDR